MSFFSNPIALSSITSCSAVPARALQMSPLHLPAAGVHDLGSGPGRSANKP